MHVAMSAWEELSREDEPLGEYVGQLGNALDTSSTDGLHVLIPKSKYAGSEIEGYWAQGVLKMGSAIALSAYRETGYHEVVDEQVLQTGVLFAELGGIPHSYAVSSQEDAGLVSLVEVLVEADELREAAVGPQADVLRNILFIGAGCTRHYLQQAVEMAA